jgi:hypothetical protein
MTSQRRSRPKEDHYNRCREIWQGKRHERAALISKQYGRELSRYDAYGHPVFKGGVDSEDPHIRHVVLGLERAYEMTGDPVFEDARIALDAYALAGGKPRKSFPSAHDAAYGDRWLGYLQNMRWFCDRRRYSIRQAAAEVASYYFVPADRSAVDDEHKKVCAPSAPGRRRGDEFDLVTRNLRDRYSRWKRDGFPTQEADDPGDLGFRVYALPVGQRRVPIPGTFEPLPAEGSEVPFTLYWRGRWRDGDVTLRVVR